MRSPEPPRGFARFSLVLILLFAAGCGDPSETYEPVWHDTPNVKILEALDRKGIEDCDRYRFKRSTSHIGMYRVRCTGDGDNRVSYNVWTETNEVEGPFDPDPKLD